MNPLNCREVTKRMALDNMDTLPWRERLTVRFHLMICMVCRKYERQLRTIAQAFQHSIRSRLASQNLSDFKRRLIDELGKS